MSSWGCTKCVKKIISLILSLAICAAMLPAAFAANEDLIFRDARTDFFVVHHPFQPLLHIE